MATTANRVSVQTSDEINRRLRLQMEERLARYETRPDQIDTRLAELDREWDIERALEANASTLAFAGQCWRPRRIDGGWHCRRS